MSLLDSLKHGVHTALTTGRGDSLLPLRVSKDLGRRLNVAFGKPIASREELASRKAARDELARLRAAGGSAKIEKEAAPVFVYFMKNKNVDALAKIERTLSEANVRFEKRDVSGDEAMISFITREAKCDDDDLPVVFVATKVIGGAERVVESVASGELAKLVG
jgi:glutaredoxin-related protein